MKDNDLAGIAFIDTQIYAHRLLSAKSLILVADVYKSITLLRFQEEFRTLSLVGRVSFFLPINLNITCKFFVLPKNTHGMEILEQDFLLFDPETIFESIGKPLTCFTCVPFYNTLKIV